MKGHKCKSCPECGNSGYVNKNLVGDGFRQCSKCHQEWWTDVCYDNHIDASQRPIIQILNEKTQNIMKIEVHLSSQSRPIIYEGVINAYTKDTMYCILTKDKIVHKYPTSNIFRVVEEY